ncbi:MAG TPA: hypothetical protein DEG88_01160, partial [Propionibacteriaceae bacterium]|nr:hypothetical protein [Propionibacteriaceae bacterium]
IVMARANATYWLGRGLVGGLRRTRVRTLMESRGYVNAQERLARYGAPAVTLSFLTVGVQTLVNLAAGASKMPQRSYLPAVCLGSLIWAVVYATLGAFSLEALRALFNVSPVLAWLLAAITLASFITFVTIRVRRQRVGEPS